LLTRLAGGLSVIVAGSLGSSFDAAFAAFLGVADFLAAFGLAAFLASAGAPDFLGRPGLWR